MTPRERLLAAFRGDRVDRVPLQLEGFEFASPDGIEEPTVRELAVRIADQTCFQHSVPSYVSRYLVTPPQRMRDVRTTVQGGETTVTTQIDTPKGVLTAVTSRNVTSRTVWTVKYPVETREDIEKIRSVPWEPPPRLRPPDLSSLPAGFDRRGFIRTGVSSPFVCVAGMMPFERFLELCAEDGPLLRELTAICLERILAVLDVLLSEKTVECVWMGGCEWLTPPMGAPDHYRDLVQAFEKPVIERIHAAGAISHIHCHGRMRSTLESVIERGGDYVQPMEPPPDGDITMAEAKAVARGRITLGGNVEARLLENESADTVEQAVRAAFEGGRERMVLETTAGPIGPVTPRMLENYHRLIDVWEELSPVG